LLLLFFFSVIFHWFVAFAHTDRRCQDFVWGAFFFLEKADDLL